MVIEEQGLLNLPDQDRAKRHVQMHIYNKAAALVRDVQPISAADAAAAGDDEETLDEYLDRLQVRFLPVSAQLAMPMFGKLSATQGSLLSHRVLGSSLVICDVFGHPTLKRVHS